MGVMLDTIIFFALYCFCYYLVNVNKQTTTKACEYFLVLSLIYLSASFQSSHCPQSYSILLPHMKYYPVLVFCTFCV